MSNEDMLNDDMMPIGGEQEMQVYAGVAPINAPKPAFRLTRMPPRMRKVTKCVRDDGGFRMETVDVEDKGGFMLTALKGHSVYLKDLSELRARGLDRYVPMLVGDGDEPVAHTPTQSVTTNARKAA